MIIRTQQTRLGRLVDILATLFAWVLFIWLVIHGINKTRLAERSSVEIGNQLFATINSLLLYTLLAALITLILLGWAKYNQVRAARYQRRQRIPNIEDSKLCQSFHVEPSVLPLLHQEQIMTFFNDHHGNIDSALLSSQNRVIVMQPSLQEQQTSATTNPDPLSY